MKAALFLLLISGFSAWGFEINDGIKERLGEVIARECPDISSWKAEQFSIDPAKIDDITTTGKQFCYSGTKKVLAKLGNGKAQVLLFNITVLKDTFVFRRDMSKGEIITENDVEKKPVEVKSLNQKEIANDFFGYQAKGVITKDTPLYENMLQKIRLVKRGEKVVVSFRKNNVAISMEAISKGDAGINDTVVVQNSASKKLFFGRVVGSGEISIGGEK